MAAEERPTGPWFKQAEQCVDEIETAHLEGAEIKPAGIALAILRAGLAVAEALGGVENELREIDAQINTLGGELHEQLRQGNRLLEDVERALRG